MRKPICFSSVTPIVLLLFYIDWLLYYTFCFNLLFVKLLCYLISPAEVPAGELSTVEVG